MDKRRLESLGRIDTQAWQQWVMKERQTGNVDLITVYDATSANLAKLPFPAGVKMAGYATGSGGVPWTDAQWRQHPDAIRIDQSPVNTPADELCDVLDVEHDGATLADIPQWVHAAWGNYHTNRRPGQRTPTIYMSRSLMTPVANTLVAAGITSGVNLWLAAPMDMPAAAQLVTSAGGPYPIIGVQHKFLPDHDESVFNAGWFDNVSGKTQAPPLTPGMQSGWRFCHKCKGLFYGPEQYSSHCAAGGPHDGSKSHTYSLEFVK